MATSGLLTLQETRSIYDSMNIPKIEIITYICILYFQSSINFQFSHNLAGFPDILNYIRHKVGFGIAKTPNVRVQCQANLSKQEMLLDVLDVSPLKWRVCGCGFNRLVHEGMNHISNVEVHLKTRNEMLILNYEHNYIMSSSVVDHI